MVNTRAGGDAPFLLVRAHQVLANLEAGAWPARWMPDAAYGLGYPALHYYAALPYYLAALLARAGLGLLGGLQVTQALGFLLAGWGAYALARAMGAGGAGALLASAAYSLAPFHLVNVYVRGDALSEFTAMGLLPVALWAATILCQRPSGARVALLGGSYALLIVSHNITALVSSPLLVAWLLAQVLERPAPERRRALILGAAALGLGLLLSAWFWLPALGERALVQLDAQTTGYLHFGGHFRAGDLVQLRWLHDYTMDGAREPFAMGLAQAALGLAGLGALVARRARGRRLGPTWALAALALVGYTWLITPWSRPVWERLPLLAYAQFPWRLLAVQALLLGLVAAQLAEVAGARLRLGVALAGAALLAVAGLGALRLDRLPLRAGDVTPERLMLYETYSGNIGATIRHEYLPREMVPRPYASAVQLYGAKPAPLALEGALTEARLLGETATGEAWQLDLAEPSLLAFHTAYWPGWGAVVDGQAHAIEPLPGLGLIGLRLEAGVHQVRLRLGP
ncbi:MAG: 6-pyruvoyl-tetrahydropterin synthase-related protein, partial [Chloroflexota bacterium]